MKKINTVHTSRTMMFSELEKIMDYSIENDEYVYALEQNIMGKKSGSGITKTSNYLKSLYKFDLDYPPFKALKYFWKITERQDKPLLALIYAVYHDDLLKESIDIVKQCNIGEKLEIKDLEDNIEKRYPDRYSENTKKSLAQNIASSWKQAGYIQGKVKNIKVNNEISVKVACFSFILAYISGLNGDYIWRSAGCKALLLGEEKLRELAITANRQGLLLYQSAGDITVISFDYLMKEMGIDGIKD